MPGNALRAPLLSGVAFFFAFQTLHFLFLAKSLFLTLAEKSKKIFRMKSSICMELERVTHPFEPFYQNDSKILILGSFPSIKSRADGFYYGNKQNRFWKMLSIIFAEKTNEKSEISKSSENFEPQESSKSLENLDSIEQKKNFLRKNKIALYDTIKECSISGSADSSIRGAVPADIKKILKESKIEKILLNGKTAEKYFLKYQSKELQAISKTMPSTSPANAVWTLEKLVQCWSKEFV